MIYSYGRDAQLLLVGSATAASGGAPPPLTWEELARDLLIAHHWTEQIAIHSLIGCVRQGFLRELIDFDWTQALPPRPADFRPFCRKRTALEVALWASRFLGWAGAGLLALLALARLLSADQRES